MASGDFLCAWFPADNMPPASLYATEDWRNAIHILNFDDSTKEGAVFRDFMPANYSGGTGVTLTLVWAAATDTNTAHTAVFNSSFERCDPTTDMDSDSFATAIAVTSGVIPSASGKPIYTVWSHTNLQMDGVLPGDLFRLKIERDGASGSDTVTGDAQLVGLMLTET